MLKQLLSKLPRKSSKSDSTGSGQSRSSHAGLQRTTSGNVLSSRPTAPKRTSSAVFPSSVVTGIEPLLAFKDVPTTERLNLFISKLSLCCVVFDFTDPSKSTTEKDVKRLTLMELVDFMDSGPPRFTEPAILAMCRLCANNLFRTFPPNYRPNASGSENDDDEPMFDPAWSHLQIVYDLFLKFVVSPSLEAKVAEKALFFWNNDQIVNLIAHNRHVILPILFPALERNAQTHWNHSVLNSTLNVRKMFTEMDDMLLVACHAHFKEEEAKLSLEAQKQKETWVRLEIAASLQPITGNTAVLVTPLVSNLH
ncbi:protein phosphatase 2A regulatory B subunit family protein [Actinidia rufa]|uniref:Protein phosphatase 2A regulatory B subunit family protein n=1 Tax=Actinidia rufa TaxID=165716 RepID=A0A7J0DHF2_9ERIC|nr:protein phosphatase 2A regulatory B subunit family protein [Actinidia rufa]